jgi:hypothetical protein
MAGADFLKNAAQPTARKTTPGAGMPALQACGGKQARLKKSRAGHRLFERRKPPFYEKHDKPGLSFIMRGGHAVRILAIISDKPHA